MKFIKTADGEYLNLIYIKNFYIDFGVNDICVVFAHTCGADYALAEFFCDPKSTTQFDPKEAAQAWLDDFVANLNAEKMKNGKSDKTT